MKILAVILFLGIMLSSCGNKADSERLNDSAFTTTAESSVVDSDRMEVDEARRSVMRAVFRATARRTI